MKKSYKVSEEFIREAYNAACQDWKRKLEKKFPDVFKIKTEEGYWYEMNLSTVPMLIYVTNIEDLGDFRKIHYFGFDYRGDFSSGYFANNEWEEALQKAPEQIIKSKLIIEAKKRGLVPDIYIQSIWCPDPKKSPYKTPDEYRYIPESNSLILDSKTCSLTIFKDGVWAKPCDIPTQQEIDRVLNYLKEVNK